MPIQRRKSETAPQARRLQFLSDFMAATHTDAPEIAQMMKISRASVYTWFSDKCDDVRLSQAMDIIDYKGYVLDIVLSKPGDEEATTVADVQKVVDCRGGNVKLKRLSFLFLALERYDIGVMALAKAIGVQYTTFRYWCCTDNMMVSRIFQIADAYGLNVTFNIRRKPAPEGDNARRCRINIDIENGYSLA